MSLALLFTRHRLRAALSAMALTGGLFASAQPQIQDPAPSVNSASAGAYRLQPSDSVEISFPFSPEYNQEATVQPDGTVALKEAAPVRALGATLAELDERVAAAYRGVLRDPKVYAVLKDFQKPSFYASGEVNHPGRYELRVHTFLMQALSEAGGVTQDRGKRTEVVVFRPQGDGIYASHVIDIKAYVKSKQPFEDFPIQAGDVIFVPQNTFSKIARFLPSASVAAYAPGL
jgi:protein involved in polysaccharide export with SLBB domain